MVVSNRADAYGLQRAHAAGVQTKVISHKSFKTREEFDRTVDEALVAASTDFVCLAGFMRLLSGLYIYWCLNLGLALFPKFKPLINTA